jgi:hypothetical chaperone protein
VDLSAKSPLSYGLDFGTSNSAVSAVVNGRVNVLPICFGSKSPEVFQSAMYFKDGFVKFASDAVETYLSDLSNADIAANKLVVTDNQVEVFQGSDKVTVNQIVEYEDFGVGRIMRSFKSVLGNRINFTTTVTGKPLSFEDLLAIFIKEIKTRADSLVGYEVNRILIGRPVKFVKDESDGKIPLEHLTKAAKLAGFKEVEFEFEPVGAAFGYGIESKEKVLVFDFGGGTMDTSIVDLSDGKVIASHGSPIGGDLMDQALYDQYLAKYLGKNLRYGQKQMPYSNKAVEQMISWFDITEYRTRKFFDYLDSVRYLANEPDTIEFIRYFLKTNLAFSLRKKIVDAKERLSDIALIDFVFRTPIKDLMETFERKEFEKSIDYYLDLSQDLVKETLTMAELEERDIDRVIMTGGSSLIPRFKHLMEEMFEKDKVLLYEPFTAVSKGLAVVSSKRFL